MTTSTDSCVRARSGAEVDEGQRDHEADDAGQDQGQQPVAVVAQHREARPPARSQTAIAGMVAGIMARTPAAWSPPRNAETPTASMTRIASSRPAAASRCGRHPSARGHRRPGRQSPRRRSTWLGPRQRQPQRQGRVVGRQQQRTPGNRDRGHEQGRSARARARDGSRAAARPRPRRPQGRPAARPEPAPPRSAPRARRAPPSAATCPEVDRADDADSRPGSVRGRRR